MILLLYEEPIRLHWSPVIPKWMQRIAVKFLLLPGWLPFCSLCSYYIWDWFTYIVLQKNTHRFLDVFYLVDPFGRWFSSGDFNSKEYFHKSKKYFPIS